MSIWSFKRKRDPYGKLIKHKSRMCAHGGIHKYGVNYWETYSPAVNWMSVRAMLTLSILREIHNKSVFFLAYTHDDVKTEILMELPIGFGVEGAHPIEWVIRLDKNLYGLKYSGLVWFEKLKEGLEARYFVQSQVDTCVWYK